MLKPDLVGEILSVWVTLVDDPTLPKGLVSRPFDAEGTPAKRTVVVEKGVFKTFLHNTETARVLYHPTLAQTRVGAPVNHPTLPSGRVGAPESALDSRHPGGI